MKIWSVQVPVAGPCAQLLNLWIETPYVECKKCGAPLYEQPCDHIAVELEQGRDKICDFTFTIGPVVLKAAIADELLRTFSGFVKGEIRMPDHPNLRKPKRMTKRTRQSVWLPYEGPELCYMKFRNEIPFHPSSTVEIESSCDACKSVTYKGFQGIETKNSASHVPRQTGKGFFFEQKALGEADFFRPQQTGFTLCTDRAKVFILERGYSNVEFLEVGDVLVT